MKRIDVVIPTGKNIYESNYSLVYTLRSVLSQTILPESITVVENRDNLQVAEVVEQYFGNLVSVIKGVDKSVNISYARNLGARRGSGEILLFLDDDVILGYTDYFERILNIMDNIDFCCGAKRYWTPINWYKHLSLQFPIKHNLLILKAISFSPKSIERSTGEQNCSEYSYIGNFGAIKRSTFEEIGGFDEEYVGWLYQDTDLMMRLVANNFCYEVLSYTEMFCFHLSHPAQKEQYRKINHDRYFKKQRLMGVSFNNKNFFGKFEDNDYSLIIYHK